MKIEYIYDKGSGIINEDNYLIKNKLFGLFDGATSLDKYIDKNGKTGGFLASLIAKETFMKEKGTLIDLAKKANNNLKKEMISRGINISNRLNLWSTSAAVIKINKNAFEWVQIGDSLILVIYEDNTYKLLVEDYDHDKEIMLLWKELADKNIKNIWDNLLEQIKNVRRGMNISYGIINGEKSMSKFLNHGKILLKDVKHILLFSDGLFIPKIDPNADDYFDLFVKLYLKGGLENIKKKVRSMEKSDPDCLKYPRIKQYDDIAAVSITL
jgi:hypothetical protein